MKVLLAESDKPAAEAIRTALKMCGCRVVSAATAGGCLTAAKKGEFDLLFIDLSLSHPSGVGCEDVIRQLKDMNPEIRIVTMANENTRELEHRVRRHGILCYLTKPVLPSLVRELVLHLRERKRVIDYGKAHRLQV